MVSTQLKGKKIFITGAGFLTRHFIAKWYDWSEFTVYSRGESNLETLHRKFPQVKCILGDIADYDHLYYSSKGSQIGIFTAALKVINKIDENPLEAIKTIAIGGLNSRLVAERNHYDSAVLISTDKEVSPITTSYGLLKKVATNNFLYDHDRTNTRLSVVRYGNVCASDKSILAILPEYIRENKMIDLYHEDMTRFYILIEDAITTIEQALLANGQIVIPKLKSFKIMDLFDLYGEKYGLNYRVINKPRHNEKIHESLIDESEMPKTICDSKHCYIDPSIVGETLDRSLREVHKLDKEKSLISSEHNLLTKEELKEFLVQHDYFMPKN